MVKMQFSRIMRVNCLVMKAEGTKDFSPHPLNAFFKKRKKKNSAKEEVK